MDFWYCICVLVELKLLFLFFFYFWEHLEQSNYFIMDIPIVGCMPFVWMKEDKLQVALCFYVVDMIPFLIDSFNFMLNNRRGSLRRLKRQETCHLLRRAERTQWRKELHKKKALQTNQQWQNQGILEQEEDLLWWTLLLCHDQKYSVVSLEIGSSKSSSMWYAFCDLSSWR